LSAYNLATLLLIVYNILIASISIYFTPILVTSFDILYSLLLPSGLTAYYSMRWNSWHNLLEVLLKEKAHVDKYCERFEYELHKDLLDLAD
jgi:hypothetical protein